MKDHWRSGNWHCTVGLANIVSRNAPSIYTSMLSLSGYETVSFDWEHEKQNALT